jgi:hypothetical protein
LAGQERNFAFDVLSNCVFGTQIRNLKVPFTPPGQTRKSRTLRIYEHFGVDFT